MSARGHFQLLMPVASGPPPTDYVSAVLALNPTAYWRFNESSGTTAADDTGNGNTAVFTATPDPEPVFGNTGIVNNTTDTCELNATGVYATIPEALMSLATDTSEKTILGWIQSTDTNDNGALLTGRQAGGNGILDFVFGANGVNNGNTGRLSVALRGDNGSGLTTVSVPSLQIRDGNIHMFGLRIKSDKTVDLFQDGAIEGTGTHTMSSGVTVASGNARIFDEALNGSIPNFVGYAGHLAIWDTALSDADIASLYAIGS